MVFIVDENEHFSDLREDPIIDDEIFDEIKRAVIELLASYDNTHGCGDEKVNRIKDLENSFGNACYIAHMLNKSNQGKILLFVSEEAGEVLKRILWGDEL